jgi:glycosyltransferase involved in cell wall biosynthesis
MRIAIARWTARQIGGAETYLARTVGSCLSHGHQVAFCYELDEPEDRPRLSLSPDVPTMSVAELGAPLAVQRVREWRPDVVYVHGLNDPVFEEHLQSIAPAVLFAHDYYGTCISGAKTHRLPVIQPCARTFGPACLALYYPRRCGGLNPVTLARDYLRQGRRSALLKRYAAVLTHSEHMRQEYLRHGAAHGQVFNCSIVTSEPPAAAAFPVTFVPADRIRVPHLIFAGRMDPLKGGEQLLRAAARALADVPSGLRVTLAGDGPERARWETVARDLSARHENLSIHFTGWLGPAGVARLLAAADVLVMPSLWPEPFGLIGQEANRQGVPVVAYATGGIPEWLDDGVNGCLAPGDPPTVDGLADALVRCLSDRPRHRAMRRAAVVAGHSRPDDLHLQAVLDVLERVAGQSHGSARLALAR